MSQVHGEVAPGFERVKDAFAANFEHNGEVGAACSVYHHGEKVVDLWGGVADEESGRPWAEDSIIVVDLDDPNIEPIGERARQMLEAATTPKSYIMQEQTTTPLDMSAREFRAAELPAANGVTDACSLARMYASLIGDGVDGVPLFTDETVRLASAPQADGPDEVMGIRTRFGAGFYLYTEGSNMIRDGAFGHGGAGGSKGFADPKADIGFGYVMNKMQMVGDDDPRTVSLARAVHESLKA